MRHENWQSILAREIEVAAGRRFEWGSFDCCLWPADMVLAITGVDHAAELRGTYDEARGALRAVQRVGGLRAFVTGKVGEPISPAYARRGDVVMREYDGWEQLGICEGATSLFTGEIGLVRARTLDCALAWRVD